MTRTPVGKIRRWPEPWERKTDREILKRKLCPEFRRGMSNRELVGEMRYAGEKGLDESYITKRELDDSFFRMLQKIVAYFWTRNSEYLIDIAVYAELLYNNSMYFEAEDQSESGEFRDECTKAAIEMLISMARYR